MCNMMAIVAGNLAESSPQLYDLQNIKKLNAPLPKEKKRDVLIILFFFTFF